MSGIILKKSQALDVWRRAVLASVHTYTPDLSARQMVLRMSIYLTPPPHTVRSLAELMGISKPAITRAGNRLS